MPRSVSRTWVEIVGRAGGTGARWGCPGTSANAILRFMADLQIRVGDLNFTARWEPAAPQTIEALKPPLPPRPSAAIRRLLPLEAKLIHCRWTGESTWIPFGDFRPGLDYENHTSHPG